MAGGLLLATALVGGGGAGSGSDGHLTARPRSPKSGALSPGLNRLGFGGERDGDVYIPLGYQPGSQVPLVVLFHGAGQSGEVITSRFRALADEANFVILAPDSRGRTWDIISTGTFGSDPDFINRSLVWTFDRVSVDPKRVIAAGFSDGATYALSIGLTNGDLFSRIMAFSPGFARFGERRGKPAVLISHGTRDPILHIDATSRVIVPDLIQLGYTVDFREFDGVHTIPEDLARSAVAWMKGDAAPAR